MGYELGPCQILYRPLTDSTGPLTDLGKTLGGVELSINETFQQLKTDQDGEVPVDEYITGTVPVITGRLADISLSNLAFTLKTTVVTDTTKQKVEVIPHAGTSLMVNGVKLVIKPYDAGVPTTNANRWITLPKAGIRVAAKLQYDNTNQRVIEFTATGYPDDDGNVLVFGDETASDA
jgi:hypothetical protein